MPLPKENIEWMLRDSGGVPIEFKGAVTFGHFDAQPAQLFDGEGAPSLGTEKTVVIATAALSPGAPLYTLGIGARIRVDHEKQYDVVNMQPEGDGEMTRLFLADV